MPKIKILHIFISLLVIFIFTSCYSYRNSGLLQQSSSLPNYSKEEFKEYRIRVNDEIIYRLITVDETFSKLVSPSVGTGLQNVVSYRVYPDGTIDLPFVRNIKVEGLTLDEAHDAIQNRLREIIPDVIVKLTLTNKTYTVIGEINSGVYPIYKEKMTIFQALAGSSDLHLTGDRKNVRIIRETNDGIKILEFDIRPSSIIDSEYYYIYPNDIIYVQKSPSSFYKVQNYSSFLGIITSSVTLFFTVLFYSSK